MTTLNYDKFMRIPFADYVRCQGKNLDDFHINGFHWMKELSANDVGIRCPLYYARETVARGTEVVTDLDIDVRPSRWTGQNNRVHYCSVHVSGTALIPKEEKTEQRNKENKEKK